MKKANVNVNFVELKNEANLHMDNMLDFPCLFTEDLYVDTYPKKGRRLRRLC